MGNESESTRAKGLVTKDPPKGWPRISSAVFYDDAPRAIDWLCNAFGFEVRIKVEGEGGVIVHCELDLGRDGLLMVGTAGARKDKSRAWCVSPRSIGGNNTQSLCVYVDDADAHCERARAAGAKIVVEPETHDHGEGYWVDRGYEAEDLEGHHWWFVERVLTRSG